MSLIARHGGRCDNDYRHKNNGHRGGNGDRCDLVLFDPLLDSGVNSKVVGKSGIVVIDIDLFKVEPFNSIVGQDILFIEGIGVKQDEIAIVEYFCIDIICPS